MKINAILILAMLSGLVSCLSVAQAAEPVSIESLLHEMVDREVVARFPQPDYTCKQFSSYDRDAVNPNDKATWFANWDRSQFVRIDDKEGHKEYVMMDTDGPGAVVRLWATWHGPGGGEFSNGTCRIYIDGAEKPTIEGPIAEIIDGGILAGEPLSQGVSPKTEYRYRGHNLYLPIPYASHCKITYSTDVPVDQGAREGEALYYQINYRTYAAGTEVESFSMDKLASAKATLKSVQETLREESRDDQDAWQTQQWNGELAPGQQQQVLSSNGPGAIRQLQFKLDAEDISQALRSTVLEVHFDGERTIWAPIGDFFGTGYQSRPFQTWYTQVTDDGTLSCVWVMPFEKNATVSLKNVGRQPVTVTQCEAKIGDWKWDPRSMHFHSTWRQLADFYTGGDLEGEPQMDGSHASDVNYVTVKGKGVYVGDTLTIFNGAPKWWGEGDEKIYVDGEGFPSHFGTGTEDYYGYAWCRPEFFQSSFHAQPEGGGNLAGGFSVNSRYRTLDAIPFEKSIRFDMELWHWAKTKVDYAPTTFFYAMPGATANVEPHPKQAARTVTLASIEKVEPFRAEGVLEGEDLAVSRVTGGSASTQNIPQFRWSNNQQLWWTGAKLGDELELRFPVEQAGRYHVFANLTKARDYGIVAISVNGKDAKEDLYDRYHTAVEHDKIDLGEFELKKGDNSLEIRMVDTNPEALPLFMFGLDYLGVEAK